MLRKILLLIMITAAPSQAKINILLGTGVAIGLLNNKPWKYETREAFFDYCKTQILSLNMPFQVEHEFGNNLMWGLSANIACITVIPYTLSIGPFFGGQIHKTQKYTCYMKGGIHAIFAYDDA